MTDVTIEGICDARFERVHEAFAANFFNYRETGASVWLVLDGRVVVGLWGGWADKARTRPWKRDTIVDTYSTTKGLTAICAHRLADEGRLELDAPVAEYWPEFSANGKNRITMRQLMNHRAGLPAVRKPLKLEDLYDWQTMTGALAAEEPWWEPGTRHGYHALTFGYLVDELIRRVAGRSVGNYFRGEIAGPLSLDAHIGLDARDDDRVAEMIGVPPPAPGEFNLFAEIAKNPDTVTARTFANPPVLSIATVNSRGWRGAEIPAANGHTNARALARLYGALARGGEVEGVRVMAERAIPALSVEESCGPDRGVAHFDALFGGLHALAAGRRDGPPMRAPSATQAPAARSALPIPRRKSASATR